MIWNIEWDDKGRRELRKLDPQIQREILRYLRERIAASENPRTLGKPLSGTLNGLWRYRLRDYRIVCHIQEQEFIVVVVRVAHRGEVYDTPK